MAESDLIRGNVDTIILKVLYEGDRYGYDLIKQINARGDGQWEIKQPTVYACLKRLEKQGFISSYWDSSESDGGRRKYYSLTDSGKQVFLKYKSEFERASALFGGLISGGDTMFMSDDYSDVEDETYSVSKRRAPRPKRKKQPEHSDIAETFTPAEHTDYPAPEFSATENVSELSLDAADDGFFEDFVSLAESLADEPAVAAPETPDENDSTALAAERSDKTDAQSDTRAEYDVPPAREAADPRKIIDQYYRSERGESYADVYTKKTFAESTAAAQPQPPAPVKAQNRPAPIMQAPTNSVQPRETQDVYKPQASVGFPDPNESDARREYKTVLTELVDRLEVSAPLVRGTQSSEDRSKEEPIAEEQAAVVSDEDKQFGEVKALTGHLGTEVRISRHNNSAQQYARKYYYYSNRLMMAHYTIMCAAMFLIGLTLFLTFYSGLKLRMAYDYLLYMGAGLLPIVMFLVATACFAGEPNKRKRINVNFNFSVFIRCIIMIQVAVVIYCVNLIWGMPVGFSYAYMPSLLIPLAYALFIPISKVIFMALLQSGHYAVE